MFVYTAKECEVSQKQYGTPKSLQMLHDTLSLCTHSCILVDDQPINMETQLENCIAVTEFDASLPSIVCDIELLHLADKVHDKISRLEKNTRTS